MLELLLRLLLPTLERPLFGGVVGTACVPGSPRSAWQATRGSREGSSTERAGAACAGYIEQMLKASAQGSATRDRIVDAAFETLRHEGFARTSARAIARRGEFNQALIFYHFGSVNDLLLAALDRLSNQRMERYREVLRTASEPMALAKLGRQLYLEDVDSGHSTVLADLFAASSGNSGLRDQMLERMQPWLEFTESLIRRLVEGSPFASLIDARAAASAVLAMYVGVDLLIHLDGDRSRATAMFDAGDRLAAALEPLLGGSGP